MNMSELAKKRGKIMSDFNWWQVKNETARLYSPTFMWNHFCAACLLRAIPQWANKMGKKLCLFSVKSISRKNNLNVDFLSFFRQNSAFVQKLHVFPNFKPTVYADWLMQSESLFRQLCRGKMWKMRKFFEEYWLLHKYATSTVKMLCRY